MSTCEQQYLGMYIQMEYKKETGAGWNEQRICPQGHTHNTSGTFCGQCGSEIEIERTKPLRYVTFDDLIADALIPAGLDDFCVINLDSSDKTWLVQNLTKSKYGVFLEDAPCGLYALSTNSEKTADAFNSEFADLITSLKKHCKNVKVGYGLIKYYT